MTGLAQMIARRTIRATHGRRAAAGFTLVELVGVMVILVVILTAVTALFISGSQAEVDLNRRFQAQQEARLATDRMRQEVHCASDLTLTNPTSVTITLPAACPTSGGSIATVTYSTSMLSTERYEVQRNGQVIADYVTTGNVFSYIAPSVDTLGKLHVDFPVNVFPAEQWKQWRLATDIVLRNTVRA